MNISSDSTRRAVRTALDFIPGFLGTLIVLVGFFDLSAATVAKVTGVVGTIVLLSAKIRNALEDAGYLPALLKAPASEGANPMPDSGAVDSGYLGGLAILLLGLVLAFTLSLPLGIVIAVVGILILCANVSYT